MKIRNGFISNSSSSSFIVAFPRKPKSAEDVRKILFGDKSVFLSPYGDVTYLTIDIATVVYNDIINDNKHVTKKIIYKAMRGHLEGFPPMEKFKMKHRNKSLIYDGVCIINANFSTDYYWDAYEKACDKIRSVVANKFILNNKGKRIYIFSYGDEDGDFSSTMEHGGIFDRLPHITISNH